VYIRKGAGQTVLVINNLSRYVQPVELDLRHYDGWTPVEIFGETRFPPIGELPYFLTLAPHGFYWFRLDSPQG
jgi:maltose alpha-D-glucosyltransferase / alpha-amylase